ncbi:MAG: DUF2442 domain-containing protein [Ginsengibacter sp.]|jgi:hypothetical protein
MKKVILVKPLEDFILEIEFDSGETGFFDAKPYLDKGIFTELKNVDYFRNVRTNLGSICWENGQDFSPETLYDKSIKIETKLK